MTVSYKFTLMLSALMIISDVQHGYQVTAAGESCGVPAIQPQIEQPNVVGGFVARPHSWPWQCFMFEPIPDGGGRGYRCGCSVLTPEWVVTAAHCAVSTERGMVLVGAHDIMISRQDTSLIKKVANIVRHPDYLLLPTHTTVYDIMLLKLTEPIIFNYNISPICLPTEDIPVGDKCIATGWGRTSSEDPHSSDVLMQTILPIVTNAYCNESYDNSIRYDMICAGYEKGGINVCEGDSGGPLVCQTDGVWRLHGIVSYGAAKCDVPNAPGVFTRVTKFTDWIKSTIPNLPAALFPPVVATPRPPGVSTTNMSKMLHASMYDVVLCMSVLYVLSKFP